MSGVELWWLGQSGFRLREEGRPSMFFMDPFLSENESRTWEPPLKPDALATAEAVLCTHGHIDHFDAPALKAANQAAGARFKVVLPAPIAGRALDLGIPAERVLGVRPGETIEIAGARIHPVPARHGDTMQDAYTFGPHGEDEASFLGYVVELGGVRVYHAGDTIPYQGQVQRLAALKPHLALLPINGRDFFRETERDLVGNMNPREAAHLAQAIGAQVLVPMHWELFPFNRGFPADLATQIAEQYPDLTLLVFGRAARFTYRPAD